MDTPLRIAVLGPGGVGGLLAAVLARDGHDVVVVARPQTASRLAESGLSLRSEALGDAAVRVRATPRLEDEVDVVVVTVKATQLEEALESVPAEAVGGALVVPFLNGLDHVVRLQELYPSDQVVSGTIRVEAERVAPGQIVHRSPFAAIELAADTADTAAVARFAEALSATGLTVAVRDGARQILWDKLAVLAPLALFTTLDRVPWGAVRDTRWDEVGAMVREIGAAAAAEGSAVDVDRVLSFLQGVPEAMRSSMQKDADAGNVLEVDAIGGSLLRAGAVGGVPMPVTARIVRQVGGPGTGGDSGE